MSRVAKARILVTRFPFQSRKGGEELHSITLMNALEKKGHEVFFLGSCPVLLTDFKQAGFETRRAWLAKPPVTKAWLLLFTLLCPLLFVLAGMMMIRATVKWKVDTVYMLSFGEKLLMTPWALLLNRRVMWLEHARIGKWLSKNPWKIVYKFWSKWVTTVVTSNAMEPFLAPHVRGDLHAISCGVILDKSEPLPRRIVDFLKGGFTVGTVARLTVDKGVDSVVRLVHSKPDTRCLIVGDGPLLEQLKMDSDEGRVLIIPSLPRGQLMSLYKSLDLFVLAPPEMDPFGMVAAEAMWHGSPTLLTDQCGISAELMDGKDAVVVPAKFSALDRAFKKLLRQNEWRRELGAHGKSTVRKLFPLKKMVAEFESLLS